MSRAPAQASMSRDEIAAHTVTQGPTTYMRDVPAPMIIESPRLLALRLAIQSYGSVTTTGVEINILKRADAFARYLNGETDNRV